MAVKRLNGVLCFRSLVLENLVFRNLQLFAVDKIIGKFNRHNGSRHAHHLLLKTNKMETRKPSKKQGELRKYIRLVIKLKKQQNEKFIDFSNHVAYV